MRNPNTALFQDGSQYLIGNRTGSRWWFVNKLPEKYTDGYGFTSNCKSAIHFTLEEAKRIMDEEGCKRYPILTTSEC
jgi:hypothetical protein